MMSAKCKVQSAKLLLVSLLICLMMLPLSMARAEGNSGTLSIETTKAYSGMDKSYAQGYVPTVKDGTATVVLPLVGTTQNDTITVTPDIGTDSPFVYANYRFNVKKANGVFLVKLNLPLKADRQNGLYPVMFNVEYNTAEGYASQSFTVYVSITDGKTASSPELFITGYTVNPEEVNGGETFTVTVNVKNIGGDIAKDVKLTYAGSEGENGTALTPTDAINTLLLSDITSGKTQDVTFKMRADANAIAGKQGFTVTLDYTDNSGTPFQAVRTLHITVNQSVEVQFDEIALQESAESGESVILPISMMNTGKAAIYDVTCKLDMDGLFGSSVYIGEVAAGTNGMGEMKVFVGTLGESNLYGTSTGTLTITYKDAVGNEYTEIIDMHMSILEPAVDANTEPQKQEPQQVAQPVSQWYVSVIVGVAVIAIAVAVIVVVSYERKLRLR